MKLFRTIVYTLLILAVFLFLLIRHNREKARVAPPHKSAAVSHVATAY